MSDNEEKINEGVSRRDFLKSVATVSAAGAIGVYGPKETLADNITAGGKGAAANDGQIQDVIEEKDERWKYRQGKIELKKLLEPGYIGKVKTRNRMIKTAAYGWILWDAEKGAFTTEGLAYYEAIAKGGVGLMVMEDPAFRTDTIGHPLYDDSLIEGESKLVDLMHKHDCPTFAQITDFRPCLGIAASSEFYYPTNLDMNNAMPQAVTVADIKENTDMVAQCALRCQKAGYDGIEINCACTHMFATFTSRFWNKRTDEYGPQSFENRARIVTEMIQAVKDICGQDFPVGVLMNGFEMNVFELGDNTDCCTIEESIELVKLYEKAGADSIQVRSHAIGNHINGFFPDFYYMFGKADTGYGQDIDIKKYWPEFVAEYDGAGGFIETAARVKRAVSIPIITVGSMDPRLIPDVVETALQDGKIDFVAMTRPLTADPDLPNKLAAGKRDEIRPCTYCITCFPKTRCRVNAASTRSGGEEMPEGYEVQPATTKKKVLVIGGGPSGLEAARVSALRGHEVILYEKSPRLGGLMPLASMVKGKHEKILDFANYLSNQMDKLGVQVKLGDKADISTVEKIKPDVVVVAVGGQETTLDIPGINNRKVLSSESLHNTLELGLRFVKPFTLRALTNFYMPVGQKVVIIGGQIQGVQLAEFLSQRGRDVTIVDEGESDTLGLNLPEYVKERVILYNQSHGVKTLMGVKYHEITDKGMTITTSYGIKKTIEADSIILAIPSATNTSLMESLKGKAAEVYAVGDCNNPGVIVDAIESGNLTARKI